MKLEEGSVVAERFRLVRALGQGGMGEVWLAHHTRLDTPCAVKFLRAGTLDSKEVRDRFEREAKAAAQLRSNNVVQILDHGEFEDVPYIAMELLDGEDLQNRLRRLGRLAPKEAVEVVNQIAKALTRAHAAGLVHRDLKPANIFITPDDDGEIVKVLDFGIAKDLTTNAPRSVRRPGTSEDATSTQTGALIGTPSYMSPEQVEARGHIDTRTDLWSLAVLAFECVTGRLPFVSDNVAELLLKIEDGPIPKPSDVDPTLPTSFDIWFAHAAARNPSDRFQTARELADSLATALSAPSANDARRELGMSAPPEKVSGFDATVLAVATDRDDAATTDAGIGELAPGDVDPFASTAMKAPSTTREADDDPHVSPASHHEPNLVSTVQRLPSISNARRWVLAGAGLVVVSSVAVASSLIAARHATSTAGSSTPSTVGSVAPEASPASSAGPPTLAIHHGSAHVVQLAAGDGHSCARFDDGTMACWGRNQEGQLGDANPSPVPRLLPGVSDATFVASGGLSTCVVRALGKVSCWGLIARETGKPTPSDVRGAQSVALGAGSNSCVVFADGKVRCFGDIPSTEDADHMLNGLHDVIEVALGAGHACALEHSGKVYCWGKNPSGELGRAEQDSSVPIEIPKVTDILRIGAGANHTCAVRKDGQLLCWGNNDFQQLGRFDNPHHVDHVSLGVDVVTVDDDDVAAKVVPSLSNVVDVALGRDATCAIERDVGIRCWGNNQLGQLGRGSAGPSKLVSGISPGLTSPSLRDATNLAFGEQHGCALYGSGLVACWGLNTSGEIGSLGHSPCENGKMCNASPTPVDLTVGL